MALPFDAVSEHSNVFDFIGTINIVVSLLNATQIGTYSYKYDLIRHGRYCIFEF